LFSTKHQILSTQTFTTLHYTALHSKPKQRKKNWVLNNFQNPGRKTLKTTNEGLDMNNKSEETCEGQQRKA
jgi:hypothetical protein